MSQLPKILTITGSDGLPREAVADPCRKVYRTTDQAPCCGPACSYWRAVLCNQTVCLQFPLEVYVCIGDRCADGTPIANGSVISFGGYCYTVSDAVVYCPRTSGTMLSRLLRRGRDAADALLRRIGINAAARDCVPLPEGAVIASGYVCVPNCSPAWCPVIDGWFPALPCPCPGAGNLPQPVYVKCSTYSAELNRVGPCPVWTSLGRCVYVARNAVAEVNPPPNAVLIETQATYINCCRCCGEGQQGCCYASGPSVRTVYTPQGEQTTLGATQYCCYERASYRADGTLTLLDYVTNPFTGTPCLVLKIEVTVVSGSVNVKQTTWDFDQTSCGLHEQVTQTTASPIPECSTGLDILNRMLAEAGQPQFTQGTLSGDCRSGTISASVDNRPSGGHQIIVQGSATATQGEGCGATNCGGPGGGPDAAPHTGDCAGCGSAHATTQF